MGLKIRHILIKILTECKGDFDFLVSVMHSVFPFEVFLISCHTTFNNNVVISRKAFVKLLCKKSRNSSCMHITSNCIIKPILLIF